MERDRWFISIGRLGMLAGITALAFGTCLRFCYPTGALIYKRSFKDTSCHGCLFFAPDIFKFLMIALGTFIFVYFEEDPQQLATSVLFIIGGVLWGFLSATRVDRRISNKLKVLLLF